MMYSSISNKGFLFCGFEVCGLSDHHILRDYVGKKSLHTKLLSRLLVISFTDVEIQQKYGIKKTKNCKSADNRQLSYGVS
jgi:hypothetical protein